MIFVLNPEPAGRMTLTKSRVRFKHSPCSVGSEDDLKGINGLLLWEIDWEMLCLPRKSTAQNLYRRYSKSRNTLSYVLMCDFFFQNSCSCKWF